MGEGQGARSFVEEDLAGARFERCDLTGAVVRGSAVGGLEVDDPWLGRPGEVLVVNGVDVVPLVEAELYRRLRDHLAALDDAQLAGPALHVWAPDVPRQVLQSLHTILAEEWEHLRYALRDLAALEEGPSGPKAQ